MTVKADIHAHLQEVFREVFEDDSISISESMTAADLEEWDSLSHITLVLAVEKAFDVRLKAAEVGGLANVGEMIALLEQRHANKAVKGSQDAL